MGLTCLSTSYFGLRTLRSRPLPPLPAVSQSRQALERCQENFLWLVQGEGVAIAREGEATVRRKGPRTRRRSNNMSLPLSSLPINFNFSPSASRGSFLALTLLWVSGKARRCHEYSHPLFSLESLARIWDHPVDCRRQCKNSRIRQVLAVINRIINNNLRRNRSNRDKRKQAGLMPPRWVV